MRQFTDERVALASAKQNETLLDLRCDVLYVRKCFGQTFIRRHRSLKPPCHGGGARLTRRRWWRSTSYLWRLPAGVFLSA
jgi:hypothetical protein